MSGDEKFDQQLAELARLREQAVARQRAERVADEKARRSLQDKHRRAAESAWESSRELRQWTARKLTEANASTEQVIVRQHLAQRKRPFRGAESMWVIDDAVDGWLIHGGEGDFFEIRGAIYQDLSKVNPVIWRTTYLLPDAGLAVRFVRITNANRISFAYNHDEHIPSPTHVPREIWVVRDPAEFAALVASDSAYRIPDERWFLSKVERASRGGSLDA